MFAIGDIITVKQGDCKTGTIVSVEDGKIGVVFHSANSTVDLDQLVIESNSTIKQEIENGNH